MNNNTIILGIDHGYGNIKTAHTCFPTGITTHKKEPTFHNDLLIYNDHFYTIGEGHKEFTADKMMDEDYYVLTLAAIARELELRRLTSARVYLAVGLPLTWVGEQKDSFRAYLLHNESVELPSGTRTTMWSLWTRMSTRRASPPLRQTCGHFLEPICSAISATAR